MATLTNVSLAYANSKKPTTASNIIGSPVNIDQNLSLALENKLTAYEEDMFWPRPKGDLLKWDQLCPYQLIVVKAENGSYTPYLDWKFTLPLPPKSMTISTPFAIQTSVLLDGILEEHNGSPIRHIAIKGTTGLLPAKRSGGDRAGTGALGRLEDTVKIFAGTVNAIQSAVSSFKTAIDSAANSAPKAYNVYQKADFNMEDAASRLLVTTSGFAQIALLRDFLECYTTAKKKNTDEYKKLRLAFAIWKEDQVFLVTPMSFNITKDSSSPLEYEYALDLKAWKRIQLEAGQAPEVNNTPIRQDPNLIARAINTLTNARKAVQKIGTLRQAVLGDIDYVMTPFRDTILLGKDTLGASISVADIPQAVQQKIKLDVAQLKYSAKQFWNDLKANQSSTVVGKILKYTLEDTASKQDTNYGRPVTPSSGTRSAVSFSELPPELTEQIPLSTMSLTSEVRNDVLNDINRVRNLRRKDFDDYAARIRSVADKVAFLVGAGDSTYAEAYGIDLDPLRTTPTQEDWATLNALNESVIVLQQFAATADGEPAAPPTLLERFGGSAVANGIAWKTPVSKFAVPFPYGATMESLASLYLGDPNRFLEIVALNGLRAPYVDEVGYQSALLVNGKDKTIVVNANDDLYVGKTVWLSSRAANRARYAIDSIRTINGVSTIQLSDTVDSYKVADGAVLEAFLSGTTCSRNLIWIPSDVTALDPDSVITKDIPGVDVTDPMVSVGGVDLLLGADEDLALINNDFGYAVGLANIVQWVKIILSIEKDELPQHKEIGLPLSIGLTLADFSAEALLTAIKQQLSADSTFSRLDKISIVQNGNTVSIDIGAVVAGTSQPLPLNYGMKLS